MGLEGDGEDGLLRVGVLLYPVKVSPETRWVVMMIWSHESLMLMMEESPETGLVLKMDRFK